MKPTAAWKTAWPGPQNGIGVRVWGIRFRVQGLGCRVQGLGYRVQGLGLSAQILLTGMHLAIPFLVFGDMSRQKPYSEHVPILSLRRFSKICDLQGHRKGVCLECRV